MSDRLVKDRTHVRHRPSVGAFLTAGLKNESGQVDKSTTGRFYIVEPTPTARQVEGRDGKPMWVEYHKLDPAFRSFNEIPQNAPNLEVEIDKRRHITGQLQGATFADCLRIEMVCYQIPGLKPTHRRPACRGNGQTAERWDQKTGDYTKVPCDRERCPFRQPINTGRKDNRGRDIVQKPPCATTTTLWFVPVWPDGVKLPTPLMEYTSHGETMEGNFDAWREEVEKQAQLVLATRPGETPFIHGLTFRLLVSQKSSKDAAGQTKIYPVVTISSLVSIPHLMVANKDRARAILESREYLALPMDRTPEEERTRWNIVEPETIANAGSIPGSK